MWLKFPLVNFLMDCHINITQLEDVRLLSYSSLTLCISGAKLSGFIYDHMREGLYTTP